jgi:hypothetical protein
MDSTAVFLDAFKLVWRHKSFWLLGVLLGMGTVVSNILAPFNRTALSLTELAALANEPAPLIDQAAWAELGGQFVFLVVAIFALVTFFWLLMLFAEGIIIGGTTAVQQELATPWRELARRSWQMMRRFVAVDGLVFLPWFLLVLLLMLLLFGILFAGLLIGLQEGSSRTEILSVWLGGLLCLLPFGLLIPLVTTFSFLFRTLTFRTAMLLDLSAGAAVRKTWKLFRVHWGQLLFLFFLLVGIRVLFAAIFSVADWLFLGIDILRFVQDAPDASVWLWVVRIIYLLINTAVTTFLLAVTAVAWTLMMGQIYERPGSINDPAAG